MIATVRVLHPKPPSIGGFLGVGHTGHRKLEALIAASRLRFRRFVFDAARIDEQKDLLKVLQRAGCEIVLDPNSAEMAMEGRFGSSVSKLCWGNSDRPWQPSDFGNRLVHLRDPLGDLYSNSHSASWSTTPTFRGKNPNASVAVGH